MIDIYADGPTFEEIKSLDNIVQGYTFNPTLFRSLGIKNYLDACKEIVSLTNKPVSFEVIADTGVEMVRQARVLAELGSNVYVKIPITYCNGESTWDVVCTLSDEEIKLNITAIFTKEQADDISDFMGSNDSIISVFAGRLFDIGIDAVKVTKEIAELIHKQTHYKVLWASSRQVYDIKNAQAAGCDIITMPPALIKKMHLFDKTPEEYSLDTVRMFFNDAQGAGYDL